MYDMAEGITAPSRTAPNTAPADASSRSESSFQPWTNQQYIQRMEQEPCRSLIIRAPNETTLLSPDHPDRPGLTLQAGPEADRLLERARELGVRVFQRRDPMPADSMHLHDLYVQRFQREGRDNPACKLVSGLQAPMVTGPSLGRKTN